MLTASLFLPTPDFFMSPLVFRLEFSSESDHLLRCVRLLKGPFGSPTVEQIITIRGGDIRLRHYLHRISECQRIRVSFPSPDIQTIERG